MAVSGVYDVAVSAFGYVPWTATGVNVAQDVSATRNAALTPLARDAVSGQITEALAGDVPGDPVAQATVEVLGAQPPLSSQTDPMGHYILTNVPYGARFVRVSAAGYAPVDLPITVSGAAIQNVVLTPAADYVIASSGTCAPVYAWIDATGGTVYNLSDDRTVSVALPASFTFYGNPYSSAVISANGFVSFGGAYSLANGVIPFEGPANNTIYAFAMDLNPAGGGQGRVYTKTFERGLHRAHRSDAERHRCSPSSRQCTSVGRDAAGAISVASRRAGRATTAR